MPSATEGFHDIDKKISLELTTRIWWKDQEETPLSRLTRLIQGFETSAVNPIAWTDIVIKRHFPGNEISRIKYDTSWKNLISTYQVNENDKITAYGSFPCWRFLGVSVEYTGVMLAFSCWGGLYGSQMNFHRQFEGHGELTILNSAPFFGYLDALSGSFPRTVQNEKVGENLEGLLALLQSMTANCSPSKWLSFSDNGSSYIPINAHVAYYHDISQLLEEVNTFKTILLKGQSDENLPPIEALQTLHGTGYHHSFRTEEQENELLRRMKRISRSSFNPNLAHLQSVLASGKYDFFEFGGGFLVLDYPIFLHSLIDDFFLELLEDTSD